MKKIVCLSQDSNLGSQIYLYGLIQPIRGRNRVNTSLSKYMSICVTILGLFRPIGTSVNKIIQVHTCLLYSMSNFSLLVHNGTILDISTSKSKNPRTNSVYFPSCSLSEYKDRSWNYIITKFLGIIFSLGLFVQFSTNLGCFK